MPGPLYCNRTATRSTQRAFHSGGGLVAHAREVVRVGVKGEADVRVPEELLHELRVYPLGEEQRRAGVPEVVEAHVGQPRFREDRLEGAPVYVGGSQRRADPRGEHEVPVSVEGARLKPLLRLARPVGAQGLDGTRGEADGAPFAALRGSKSEPRPVAHPLQLPGDS